MGDSEMSMKEVIDHRRKDVWKMFDDISPTYDVINHILSFGLDIYWRHRILFYLPKRMRLKLLDLASGTGDQIFSLMNFSKKIQTAIGIDLSSEMLNIARKKLRKKKYANRVSFSVQNATELTLCDSSVDCATMSFGIRNIPDVPLCLREIHRVLSEGGRCMILEFSLPKIDWVKKAHLYYLRNILPKIGALISKHSQAYTYLNQTIETFPYGEDFCQLIRGVGFKQVRAVPLTFGIATLYIGDK